MSSEPVPNAVSEAAPAPDAWTPSPGDMPFDRLGGDRIRAMAKAFYDHMEAHEPALAQVHAREPDGRIAAHVREHFASFLVFWLGGPQDYLEVRGHPRLRMRHAHVAVDTAQRDAWVRCMRAAMDTAGVTGPVRDWLDQRFANVADFLRNAPDQAPTGSTGRP